jgi:hypothetical protein
MKKFIKVNLNRVGIISQEILQHLNFSKVLKKLQWHKIAYLSSQKAFAATFFAIIIFGFSLYLFNKSKLHPKAKQKYVIQAPFNGLEVKPESFFVDAAKGDTLHFSSGTQIVIPANCFVDIAGNKISGEVEIQYREFTNIKDILCSGIPMNYDSGGVVNSFESAGMIEINGFQKNIPVMINSEKSININMASTMEKPGVNLYRFDSIKNNWTVLGKDSINNALAENAEKYFINTESQNNNDLLSANAKKFIEKKHSVEKLIRLAPIAPKLANNGKFNFIIDFNKEDFRELAAFENVKFEICDTNIQVKGDDTTTVWEHVSLNKTNSKCYEVKFSTQEKSLKYDVIPVFDASNIANAKLIFEKKYKAYKKELEDNKIAKEIAQKKLVEELQKAQQQAAKQREKEIKEAEERIKIEQAAAQKAMQEERALWQKQLEDQKAQMELQRKKQIEMAAALTSITRSFQINKFGIYNTDRIIKDLLDAHINVTVDNDEGNEIFALYVLIKDTRSSIICHPTYQAKNNYHIKYSSKNPVKLLAITSNKKIAIGNPNELREMFEGNKKEINLNLSNIDPANENDFNRLINF